jgi:hypothetical protein
MRMLVAALLMISGCHKTAPPDADAVWALAPESAKVGFVLTPRGLAMLEHGWHDVHEFLEHAPGLTGVAQQVDARIQQLTGAHDLALADWGLTADKGAAYFGIDESTAVLIVPLGNRDAFLAKAHGSKGSDEDHFDKGVCRTINGMYVCASSESLFATLGKSKLRDRLVARGDLEVVIEGMPGMPIKSLAAVAQLERGEAVVRATVLGLQQAVIGKLGPAITPELDRGHSAGFGVVNLTSFLSVVPEMELSAGVTTSQLAKSIAGPMLAVVPAGQVAIDLKIPLADPAPARTLIDKCTGLLPASLTATSQAGTCHVIVPGSTLAFDAWIEGKTLRLGTKAGPQGKPVPLTRTGAELADGAWSFAFWGRGTLLAAPAMPTPADALADPQVQLGIRAISMVNEIGLGIHVDGDKATVLGVVRTAWSNPDAVVAKLTALPTADILAGKGSAFAQGLPPGAPLVADTEAGVTGLVMPLALVGLASSVGMDALTQYMHRSAL